ncbi:MAG: dihydroorotase, partial [Acidobacteriota bacterium]
THKRLLEILEPTAKTIDAGGLIVAPGLIDLHVHLREPGDENEETIASGAAAAVAGGITSVVCMANTRPAVDNEAAAEYILLLAARAGLANIFPVGAVTKGREGRELAEIGQLARAGAVAFSDDGDPVRSAEVMRRALEYAAMFDRPIITHAEDHDLSDGGVMNEGVVSMTLGLPGVPAASEEIAVARDIRLAELTGGHLHVAHVSTAGSVALLRDAKSRGVRVTAEVTPHHLTLTEESVRSFDTVYKMNPPLRTRVDVEACVAGLLDGTIDAIATDHAPHSTEEKELEFPTAPNGVIGMETMLGVAATELVGKRGMSWRDLLARMTVNPARVVGIPKGTLAPGADADVVLIAPTQAWTIDRAAFRSPSPNFPIH